MRDFTQSRRSAQNRETRNSRFYYLKILGYKNLPSLLKFYKINFLVHCSRVKYNEGTISNLGGRLKTTKQKIRDFYDQRMIKYNNYGVNIYLTY